jgi:hypothetical protein
LSYSELEMKRDLANLAAERPPFDLIQRWRTAAATDLQILVRSSEDALFGMAHAEPSGWSSGKAFCLLTLEGYGFTPYSLSHQIEHLRPAANEQNTVAPSVFQNRLSQESRKNAGVVAIATIAAEPTTFVRKGVFCEDCEALEDAETNDSLPKTENLEYNLLRYWDLLPYDGAALIQITRKVIEIPSPTDRAPKEDDASVTVVQFSLTAQPNPTAGQTFLRYAVPADGTAVRLEIMSATGQPLAVLTDAVHTAGKFTLQWDASNYPNGVYIGLLRMGQALQSARIVVSK